MCDLRISVHSVGQLEIDITLSLLFAQNRQVQPL